MKQYHEEIETQVRQTMQLLDEVKPLEVHNLFRVRLMQRIEGDLYRGSKRRSNWQIGYKLAFIVVLFVINLASAILLVKPGENQPLLTAGQIVESQSDDYSSHEFAYYDQTAAIEHATP